MTILRKREKQNLETLLLEGLDSGDAAPLTKNDFDEIRRRGLERLKKRS